MQGRLLHCNLVQATDPYYLHVKVYREKNAVWLDLLLPHHCIEWVASGAKDSTLGFAQAASSFPA
jgi:hypothetical protein